TSLTILSHQYCINNLVIPFFYPRYGRFLIQLYQKIWSLLFKASPSAFSSHMIITRANKPDFISGVPRSYRLSPVISPENGRNFHSYSSPASTISKCPDRLIFYLSLTHNCN